MGTNTGVACSTTEFIAKARAVHGEERYNYSGLLYYNQNGFVSIICPLHGVFEQKAKYHLAGRGCQKCAAVSSGTNQRGTLTDFIAKAEAKHGKRYDYSLAHYAGSAHKLTIICPLHGVFEQKAGAHARGQNCPQCADRASNIADFIAKAEAKHGKRYDYSLAHYVNVAARLTIVCPIHGKFEQKANSHLNGNGCWPCASERIKAGWVARAQGHECTLYLVRFFDKEEEFFKIGVTCRGIKARFATANLRGYKREILAICQSFDAGRIYDWERSIIRTFAALRYVPKKRFDGSTECFSSCDEILAIFPL